MTIWKFPFNVSDRFTLALPLNGRPLDVQVQNGQPCLWALVEPSAEVEDRHFAVFGTGHPIPGEVSDSEPFAYVGSFQLAGGTFVGHLFEVLG